MNQFFQEADLHRSSQEPPPELSGQRRRLVEQYYSNVDWTSPSCIRKVVSVYDSVVEELCQGRDYDASQDHGRRAWSKASSTAQQLHEKRRLHLPKWPIFAETNENASGHSFIIRECWEDTETKKIVFCLAPGGRRVGLKPKTTD